MLYSVDNINTLIKERIMASTTSTVCTATAPSSSSSPIGKTTVGVAQAATGALQGRQVCFTINIKPLSEQISKSASVAVNDSEIFSVVQKMIAAKSSAQWPFIQALCVHFSTQVEKATKMPNGLTVCELDVIEKEAQDRVRRELGLPREPRKSFTPVLLPVLREHLKIKGDASSACISQEQLTFSLTLIKLLLTTVTIAETT